MSIDIAPTKSNISGAVAIDPDTLEIQWQRLISIMDEIDNAPVRTSFSTNVANDSRKAS